MQNDVGLISIIMAAYNAEKTIEQAINSVLSQTYPDFELLVVNDCSTDKTAMLAEAIVKKDDRVRLISNEKNSGVSYTRKHGLEEASGEWVAILDSDDAWAPEKLEKQIKLQKKTNADLLFTGSAFMDADGKPIDWYLAAPAEVTYRQLLKQNVLSNSSALVRKELYAKYYAVGDGMHEDFAMWLNILKDGRKAYRECLPTTCLESLCCGTEIVSFYFHGDEGEGSFPEKYVHFIPHGDMEQLTDTVKNVSEHHEEKKNCCEAGQKIFSQKVMVENYEKIYKKLLEQSTD